DVYLLLVAGILEYVEDDPRQNARDSVDGVVPIKALSHQPVERRRRHDCCVTHGDLVLDSGAFSSCEARQLRTQQKKWPQRRTEARGTSLKTACGGFAPHVSC